MGSTVYALEMRQVGRRERRARIRCHGGWFSVTGTDSAKLHSLRAKLEGMESESLWQRAKVEGIPRVIIKACEEGEREDSDLVQMLMARAKEEHRRSNPYDDWKRIVHVEPCPAPQQASAVPVPAQAGAAAEASGSAAVHTPAPPKNRRGGRPPSARRGGVPGGSGVAPTTPTGPQLLRLRSPSPPQYPDRSAGRTPGRGIAIFTPAAGAEASGAAEEWDEWEGSVLGAARASTATGAKSARPTLYRKSTPRKAPPRPSTAPSSSRAAQWQVGLTMSQFTSLFAL